MWRITPEISLTVSSANAGQNNVARVFVCVTVSARPSDRSGLANLKRSHGRGHKLNDLRAKPAADQVSNYRGRLTAIFGFNADGVLSTGFLENFKIKSPVSTFTVSAPCESSALTEMHWRSMPAATKSQQKLNIDKESLASSKQNARCQRKISNFLQFQVNCKSLELQAL